MGIKPLGKVRLGGNSLKSEDSAVFVGRATHALAAVEAVLAGEGDPGVPVGLVEHLEAGFVVFVPLSSLSLYILGPSGLHDLVVQSLELSVAGDAELLVLEQGEPTATSASELTSSSASSRGVCG